MNEWYRYDAERAVLARLSLRLSGSLRYALLGSAIACIVCGVWLVVIGWSIGWLLASASVWLLMPLVWNERYLQKLPVAQGSEPTDRLHVDILAQLPENHDRSAIVQALIRTRSVQFMMVRAGVSPELLADDMSVEMMQYAWNYAQRLRPTGVVPSIALFAGMIGADARLTSLLPHLQLDQHDIDMVVEWYVRLQALIARHTQPRLDGGIGRDWSFGYTPLLSQFGINVSEMVATNPTLTVAIEAHQEALQFLMNALASGGKQNVALVGMAGSGKTTLVHAFAESLLAADSAVPDTLKFRQVIRLDPTALIARASGRGELEELVNALLVEAYRAKNIILCLDDAELFFEEGVGSVDISRLLQPVIDGGALRMIFTMDAQRYLQIAQRNPTLAHSLNRFTLAAASYDETMRVMQDQLIVTEFQKKVTYMYQALREAYRLSERYLYDIAQPGKALQLLRSASQYADHGLVNALSVQKAIEQTEGIKVSMNVTHDDKQVLLHLEDLLHERMINQVRAVGVVANALRRARAGVRNEQHPIGAFLFLGPTGVGKTELAKALASVYFGGEERLIRLDMNEFVRPDDVQRLIADGANDTHSLSAQIMKQPFSVILLDELEKAHDSVLTTLLQVLDEGVLRDETGREVSFRDAIIIATSNAGADHIRHHIEAGEELEQFESAFVDELINSGQFRAEFLNRFDEIVLFRPLKPEELLQVIDLIVASVNKTLAPQKVSVAITDELKQWLVTHGNDPRLGARPMRRIVQRVVENTIAKRLLSEEIQPGQTVILTLQDIPPELEMAPL